MAGQSLKFVVLWHSGIAEPHFDLMFETYTGSELATWRSPVWPIEKQTPIIRLKDHRRAYLEFEGELSEHRGQVERVAGGSCHLAIGEHSVWTIQINRAVGSLKLQLIAGAEWEAELCARS